MNLETEKYNLEYDLQCIAEKLQSSIKDRYFCQVEDALEILKEMAKENNFNLLLKD